MITVHLAHYNRPYILELNVKLLRHFVGDAIRIVVADDGSWPEVVEKIRKLPIDDIYVQSHHSPTSFSKTMRKACVLTKTDNYMFCEDDFIYLKSPVGPDLDENCLLPDMKAGLDSLDIFSVGEKDLEDPTVGMVKLQIHHTIQGRLLRKNGPVILDYGIPVLRSAPTLRICSSWPYIIRTTAANNIQTRVPMSVYSRQNHIKQALKDEMLSRGQSVMSLHPGRFLHIGAGISVNVTGRKTDTTRAIRDTKFQDHIRAFAARYNYVTFAEMLTKEYVKGRFYFDIDEILSLSILKSFESAYERLKVSGTHE